MGVMSKQPSARDKAGAISIELTNLLLLTVFYGTSSITANHLQLLCSGNQCSVIAALHAAHLCGEPL